MVVRVIADLLHYCMYKISTTGNFIDMDAIIQDAIALYNSDPEHRATPISKQAQQLSGCRRIIPYVLTDDPAKVAQFGKKFGMTQDQAVDDLIETTDWGGQDLPHLVGNKGAPTERLAALRNAGPCAPAELPTTKIKKGGARRPRPRPPASSGHLVRCPYCGPKLFRKPPSSPDGWTDEFPRGFNGLPQASPRTSLTQSSFSPHIFWKLGARKSTGSRRLPLTVCAVWNLSEAGDAGGFARSAP